MQSGSISTSEATKSAIKFIELYYDIYDSQDTRKRSVLSRFYTQDSAILWNGHVFSITADPSSNLKNNPTIPSNWMSFLEKELPCSKHYINAFDAQPCMNPQVPGMIFLSVSATVRYFPTKNEDKKARANLPISSKEECRVINQQFILSQAPNSPGTFYITSDVLRFV